MKVGMILTVLQTQNLGYRRVKGPWETSGIIWEPDSVFEQMNPNASSQAFFWEVGKWWQVFNMKLKLRALGGGNLYRQYIKIKNFALWKTL